MHLLTSTMRLIPTDCYGIFAIFVTGHNGSFHFLKLRDGY
jgi:hypothetical protein